MKENYTHVGVVLDNSGSMFSIKNDVIGGFNEFLKTQKESPSESTFSLTLFDSSSQILHDFQDISEIPELTPETYINSGSTALYDAIGITVTGIGEKLNNMEESERPDKVIIAIITDGYENASTKFSSNNIKQMIEHQESQYSWDFVFLGANQDAFLSANQIGIKSEKTMTYSTSSVGVKESWSALSRAYSDRYTGAVSFTSEEYSKQNKELENSGQIKNKVKQ